MGFTGVNFTPKSKHELHSLKLTAKTMKTGQAPKIKKNLEDLEGEQPYLGDLRSPWLLTTYPSPGMILQVVFFPTINFQGQKIASFREDDHLANSLCPPFLGW